MTAFGTDEGFADWLASAGLTLPDDAPAPATVRQQGTTYLNAVYGPRFKGVPAGGVEQINAFPRRGAVVYDQPLADDIIPTSILAAAYRAGYQMVAGGLTLDVSNPSRLTKKEKAEGVGEREYFAPPVDPNRPNIDSDPVIDALLAPFLDVITPDAGMVGLWSVGPGARNPYTKPTASGTTFTDDGLPLASEEW